MSGPLDDPPAPAVQRAIVTGAATGIGRGIAEVLARRGADVALCDIAASVHDVAADLCAETGQRVTATVADVSAPAEIKAFIDSEAAELGGLDLVVANAGIWQRTNPLTDSFDDGAEVFDKVHGTNLKGVFLTGRAAIPHLVDTAATTGSANMINIATDHIAPPPGAATGGGRWMDIYDSSKWGINGLTQSWAKVLAEHNVRVNALCMDAVESEMVRQAAGSERYERDLVGNIMHPHQIAELMLELIAEGPGGRTGENIGIWLRHAVELPDRTEVLPSRHD